MFIDSSDPEVTDATSDLWETSVFPAAHVEKDRLRGCSAVPASIPMFSSSNEIPGASVWLLKFHWTSTRNFDVFLFIAHIGRMTREHTVNVMFWTSTTYLLLVVEVLRWKNTDALVHTAVEALNMLKVCYEVASINRTQDLRCLNQNSIDIIKKWWFRAYKVCQWYLIRVNISAGRADLLDQK